MIEKQDQRICIQFCFQLGKMSLKTIQMMQAFGNECMSETRIKEWYNRLKGGRRNTEKHQRVRLAIQVDRRLTIRELENDLGIPKTNVSEIWNQILGMTRVCAVTGFFITITRQRIHRILCSSF